MKRLPSDEHKRENTFGRSCVRLRQSMGLTQRALGRLLGISEQAIQHWECGVYSPKPEHLERLLALCLERHAFALGREHEQAHQLWLAAGQQTDFEAFWMRAQLAAPSASPALMVLKREVAQPAKPLANQELAPPSSRLDWGDALDVHEFYGRVAERLQLEQWVIEERCQVVSVLGMGGIGKSALAVTLMYQVAKVFQAVIFRSVRDAPTCQDLLAGCLHVLSPQPLPTLPISVDRRIDLLLECFQTQHCLLVLDNLETLLQEHDPEGRYRPGYEDYAALLRRAAETPHQSCLLVTSRETPAELGPLESHRASVRALRLAGLESDACEQLFEERDVVGATQDLVRLAQMYAGNPLALKIVAEAISELFGGEISSFLEQDTVIFSTIRDLLAEQFARLSALEQALLTWLAVVREPLGVVELHALLVPPVAGEQVREALEALQRRSLVEQGKPQATFTLQSVVLEYVTEMLVERVSEQVQHAVWEHLISYALEQAGAKEYVRQAQEQLIVAPVILRLQASYRQTDTVEEQLLRLLNQLRTWDQEAQGYGPANLIMLLRGLRGHLRRIDLSQLAIRGAYLQRVEMQDATLAGASLRDTIFTEAFDATLAVAISSTGQYWATGSKRGEVRVWREAGQILHLVLQAHTTNTYALAFSPDERTLASGSFDGSVKLWEVASGAPLWSGWHTKGTTWLAFAPDGGMLASGGHDAIVRIWDPKLGTPLQTLPHPGPVFSLAWSPDGRLLASGDFEGKVRLWEMRKTQPARCVQTLSGHTNWVRELAFAPSGRTLASASWDGTVKLWEVGEVRSPRVRQTLTGHTERLQALAWSPDERTLASGSFDHTIWLWDVEQGSYRVALQGHTSVVNGLAFTPDSRTLLSGSDDGTLRLWDVERGQCVRVLQGYAASISDVDWSPDGTQLASAGSDTMVTIWEVASGAPPRMLSGHRWNVYGVRWSPDGSWLASSGWDNAIRLWDATTGACVQILRDLDHPDTVFSGVAWSPDGHLLASGTFLQGVLVWDVTVRSQRWVGRAHASWVRRVAWSPDGTRLVGGDEDGRVYLWDAADGTQLLRLAGHHGGVTSVAWSPDGTRLASGCRSQGQGDSGELWVWEVQSGERHPAWHPLRGRGNAGNSAFAGHPGGVSAVTWAPSGERLISGGSDGMLRWWEVHSGACVQVRQAHQGTVQSLKVSPDGSILASCGDDGTIALWDLYSGEYLRTLRRDRPYERLDITGIRGLTEAQKATLHALGAMEESAPPL